MNAVKVVLFATAVTVYSGAVLLAVFVGPLAVTAAYLPSPFDWSGWWASFVAGVIWVAALAANCKWAYSPLRPVAILVEFLWGERAAINS